MHTKTGKFWSISLTFWLKERYTVCPLCRKPFSYCIVIGLLLSCVHGQDHVTTRKSQQRVPSLKFTGFHNQSPLLTMVIVNRTNLNFTFHVCKNNFVSSSCYSCWFGDLHIMENVTMLGFL